MSSPKKEKFLSDILMKNHGHRLWVFPKKALQVNLGKEAIDRLSQQKVVSWAANIW